VRKFLPKVLEEPACLPIITRLIMQEFLQAHLMFFLMFLSPCNAMHPATHEHVRVISRNKSVKRA